MIKDTHLHQKHIDLRFINKSITSQTVNTDYHPYKPNDTWPIVF